MTRAQITALAIAIEASSFEAGVTKTAIATLSNPTVEEFTYTTELYLGANKLVTSGIETVTIPAGGSVPVSYIVVMPLVSGSYPVYLDVYESSILIAHFMATSNVEIAVIPEINVGPITWE